MSLALADNPPETSLPVEGQSVAEFLTQDKYGTSIQWLAARTKPNAEKQLAHYLLNQYRKKDNRSKYGPIYYVLPVQSVRNIKSRAITIKPIIPGYIFVGAYGKGLTGLNKAVLTLTEETPNRFLLKASPDKRFLAPNILAQPKFRREIAVLVEHSDTIRQEHSDPLKQKRGSPCRILPPDSFAGHMGIFVEEHTTAAGASRIHVRLPYMGGYYSWKGDEGDVEFITEAELAQLAQHNHNGKKHSKRLNYTEAGV